MKKLHHFKPHFKNIFILFFFSVMLCGIPVSGISQEKTIADLKKEAADAKKAAEEEIKKNNYDCDKILKAIEAAGKARDEIAERKKNMTPPKDNKDQSKDAKAYREADAAEKSATADAAAARKCAHGLATSDEIEAELGKMKGKIDDDKKLTEAEKRKLKALIDELIKAAKDAAAGNPCDPSAVRDAVNNKMAEQYEENRQEEDRPTRDLIQQWFEDNFRLDESATGKKPRIEHDAKRKRRPFTHISIHPSTPQDQMIYFTAAPSILYPLSNPDPRTMEFNALQEAVFSPEVFEALFERLQGEFVLGNMLSTQNQPIRLEGSSQIMPGIRLGIGLGRHFEVQTGAQYFQSKWSGYFPVTVFPFEGTQPQVIQGNLHAAASGILAEADAAYFLSNGAFQPFVKAGARAQIPTQNSSGGDLAGVSIPVEMPGLELSVAPFGGLGARIGLGARGYADLTGTYGKIPGGGYAPALDVSVGLKFGGK